MRLNSFFLLVTIFFLVTINNNCAHMSIAIRLLLAINPYLFFLFFLFSAIDLAY